MKERGNEKIILLTTPQSYRTAAFQAAAATLGVEIVLGMDMPEPLATEWGMPLGLDFTKEAETVEGLVAYAQREGVGAIMAIDDSGGRLAAAASDRLGLPHNSSAAAEAARDKYMMRQLLVAGGARCPHFQLAQTGDDMVALAAAVRYPCVVKPLRLSGSRGVMRADNPEQFQRVVGRLAALLTKMIGPGSHPFLIEDFIPGVEVALEGMMADGECHMLALFDKPDPLDGPFFEETIYVTPSRLPVAAQTAVAEEAARAARALGLRHGPIHAECRINDEGVWMVEIAGRSIGGLCSRILSFTLEEAQRGATLEELILRQLLGWPLPLTREAGARGVMMIPIPEKGLLREVMGVELAEGVAGVDEVVITAKLNYPVVPLPEGDSYLGFIFASGESPAAVESCLRRAAGELRFVIQPTISLTVR